MFLFEIQLLLALGLDLIIGDPRWFPHPVRIIGFFCNLFEHLFRIVCSSASIAGFLTVCAVVSVTVGGVLFFLAVLQQVSAVMAQVVAVFLLYTLFAVRDLIKHSIIVYKALGSEDTSNLHPARDAVAMIVGRDTATLDRKGIIRATIETVAENMVDGITAPIFYAVFFTLLAPVTGISPIFLAVCGAIGYKAVNTMDSMIAYKNERYLYFGKWAAMLDDFVNFLPARLSGLLIIPAAVLCRCDAESAFAILKKDRLAHASPNAAHTEAAVAGALGIELGGNSRYFGKIVKKPIIGSAVKTVAANDILLTNRLVLIASFLFLVVIMAVRFILLQTIQ